MGDMGFVLLITGIGFVCGMLAGWQVRGSMLPAENTVRKQENRSLRAEVAMVRNRLAHAERTLEAYVRDGAECETCGSPMICSHMPEHTTSEK